MNADLVVLHATARGRRGGLALDLREVNEVYEDGVRQSIRLFRPRTFRFQQGWLSMVAGYAALPTRKVNIRRHFQ